MAPDETAFPVEETPADTAPPEDPIEPVVEGDSPPEADVPVVPAVEAEVPDEVSPEERLQAFLDAGVPHSRLQVITGPDGHIKDVKSSVEA